MSAILSTYSHPKGEGLKGLLSVPKAFLVSRVCGGGGLGGVLCAVAQKVFFITNSSF